MAVLAADDDDHDVFGLGGKMNDAVRRHVGRFAQQFVVVFMAFAPRRNFGKFERRVFPEIIFDLLFGDAVARHDLRVFDAERDERRAAAEAADVEMAHAVVHANDFGERRERLLAAIAGSVNRQKTVDAEHRHGAVFRFETELDVVRLPRTLFLIFAEAHGVLARPTERRTIGVARITAADRDENQTHRPSDRRVGAKAGTEHAGVAIDIELLFESAR